MITYELCASNVIYLFKIVCVNMVLDLEVVRADPERVRENQRLRFSDESLVDIVLQYDNKWKKGEDHQKTVQCYHLNISIVTSSNVFTAKLHNFS